VAVEAVRRLGLGECHATLAIGPGDDRFTLLGGVDGAGEPVDLTQVKGSVDLRLSAVAERMGSSSFRTRCRWGELLEI
jgi:hypothetical protein